jgi:hypothetical protein
VAPTAPRGKHKSIYGLGWQYFVTEAMTAIILAALHWRNDGMASGSHHPVEIAHIIDIS